MYRSGKLGNNKETKLYQLTLKTDSLLTSIADTNALKTLNRLKVYIEADNNNIPISSNTCGTKHNKCNNRNRTISCTNRGINNCIKRNNP
jgi:hypothetical protein